MGQMMARLLGESAIYKRPTVGIRGVENDGLFGWSVARARRGEREREKERTGEREDESGEKHPCNHVSP